MVRSKEGQCNRDEVSSIGLVGWLVGWFVVGRLVGSWLNRVILEVSKISW